MRTLATRLFLARLVATERGRAHLLSLAVDAEEGDEGSVFNRLATVIDEAKLVDLVHRHREDEARHANMYRDRLVRLGLQLQPIPPQLKLISHLAHRAGGWDSAVETAEQIVRTYALLYAIEERGVQQFPLFASIWATVDAETARTYLTVTADERRHLGYCTAIGRHYAGSRESWEAAVVEARSVESACFRQVGSANFRYALRAGLLRAKSSPARPC